MAKTTKSKTANINSAITQEQRKKIEDVAERNGLSMSQVLGRMIDAYKDPFILPKISNDTVTTQATMTAEAKHV